MSPVWETSLAKHIGFPRVSGDEPASAFWLNVGVAFSPRERG